MSVNVQQLRTTLLGITKIRYSYLGDMIQRRIITIFMFIEMDCGRNVEQMVKFQKGEMDTQQQLLRINYM
jgi:hypothetical protein